MPVGAESAQPVRGAGHGQELQHAGAPEQLAQQAFKGWMDVQQGVVESVSQRGGFGGEVGVVAGEDPQRAQGLLVVADPAQRMRQSASGVGDDEGITDVGLAFSRIQIGDSAHRQPGKIGDRDPEDTSHRDRQRSN